MGTRAVLVRFLKRYPPLYRLTAKIYYALAPYHLLGIFVGTKAQEGRWARKSIAEGYWENQNHPSKRFLADKIAGFLPFSSILEVGCASGPNLYLMAKRFPQAELTGIDINAAAVEYGNRQLTKEGISNVKLLEGKADELERFPDSSFDIVFTNALLIYIGPDKIEETIKNMLRISRSALVLMECYCFEPSKDVNGMGVYYGGIWIRDYAALLKQFVPEEQIRVNRIPEDIWPGEPWASFGAVIEVAK